MAPRAGWIAAGDLVLGDRLRTPTGTDATVLGVRRDVDRAAVYTLTVAKDHTFFVGTAQVLVHNADCEEVVKLAQELKFTATAGAHQAEASRRVPLYTLADAILHGRRVPMVDPFVKTQGRGTLILQR